jgi:hypothetical protein
MHTVRDGGFSRVKLSEKNSPPQPIHRKLTGYPQNFHSVGA